MYVHSVRGVFHWCIITTSYSIEYLLENDVQECFGFHSVIVFDDVRMVQLVHQINLCQLLTKSIICRGTVKELRLSVTVQ